MTSTLSQSLIRIDELLNKKQYSATMTSAGTTQYFALLFANTGSKGIGYKAIGRQCLSPWNVYFSDGSKKI
jgi:hypothetical protein